MTRRILHAIWHTITCPASWIWVGITFGMMAPPADDADYYGCNIPGAK